MHFQKRDWKKYNKQLVNRGKINFWIGPKVFKDWKAKKNKKNGYPCAPRAKVKSKLQI